ncbi:B3 domain-containing transcription factor ABI3 [Salvia hispanica]|uniref:B3 domain-containing transcription factor ABI3 n=1 Tax=Salvia hispanica TaxID=49212 RepID=UPI00200920B6|nr:B3 domain-containing transcription factor ABI3 [Salvia hispanica]
MGKVEAAEQDLTAAEQDQNPSGFDPIVDKDMWLDMDDASIFCDDFPSLPDFPCMSSSSSSSSTQPALKPIAVTSSSSSATSAVSWAVMRSDAEEDSAARMSFQQFQDEVKMDGGAALSSTASDADMMESFGYMDLIDCNELWDPSSVFQSENPQELVEEQAPAVAEDETGGLSFLQGDAELAMIFLEWLKQNKDYISAEDMRSIKLKRSTIESASKKLGTTSEGKKQLLRLILDWVEQHRLQKKAAPAPFPFHETAHFGDSINPNPNFIYNPDPNAPQWMQPQQEVALHPSFAQPMPMNQGVVNGIPLQHSAEYPMMEHAPSWAMPPPFQQQQFSPFPENGGTVVNRYGNPYQMYDPNGDRVMRLGASATKEARKKRMARQRKLYPHPHRHSGSSNQQRDSQLHDSRGDDGGEHDGSLGDWGYWAQGEGVDPSPTAGQQPNSVDQAAVQQQNGQRPAAASDRRPQQGWKTEKNLKFLLQKVLKQSDVGNLGRIVLPKKEAESHLPELETRDGISITMEDIGTSCVWNMRYRFWPNNKSRMYLLENTGDFVRANGLQEGDFIVIYSDTKCGKYMIRGVKVRQPGGKSEGKKPARRTVRSLSSLGGNSSSPLAPIRQAIR